jgi:hypothetical protein
MNREDIIRMAREADIDWHKHWNDDESNRLEVFAALVAAAERKMLMQLFTDPENQPTQHGTVTMEYMQQEIAAEREACAKVCDDWPNGRDDVYSIGEAIRARKD